MNVRIETSDQQWFPLIWFDRTTADAAKRNGITATQGLWIIATPFVVTAFYTLFLWLDVTHDLSRQMLAENHVVELATFFVMILAAWIGFSLCVRSRRSGAPAYVWAFFAFFSFGIFFVGMEEIAWGQWFIKFATPEAIAVNNAQNELTLHNLNLWHDYIEALPLIYGAAGLIGVALSRVAFFEPIAPSALLISWFVIISLFSAVDLYHEFQIPSQRVFDYVNHLDELMELLVGVSAALFVWLSAKAVARKEAAAR